MKVLAKVFSVVAMASVVAGCASKSSDAYVPKIPQGAQTMLLDYFAQPDNKVFVIAVDPGGDFSAGYESGKYTLEEATEVAYERCEANREASGVIAGTYIYAINNEVVYTDAIAAWQQIAADKAAEAAALEAVAAEEAAAEAAALEAAALEAAAEEAAVAEAIAKENAAAAALEAPVE